MTGRPPSRSLSQSPAADSRDSAVPLGRLSIRVAGDRMDDFAEAFERCLAPIVQRHDLVHGVDDDRPPVHGFFRRIYELPSTPAASATARALHGDVAWRRELAILARRFADDSAATEGLPYRFDPYVVPAGQGDTAVVGAPSHTGVWHSIGVLDGMPSCISAMHQDHAGDLWLATGWLKEGGEWGACRYDGARLQRLTTTDGLIDDRVRSITEDTQGRLWFGTFNGISCYDGATFTSYSAADGLPGDMVWSLLWDRQDRLWAGMHDGLSCWDGEHFTTYDQRHGLRETGANGDNLIGVSSILEDHQGVIWAGTWGGLNRWEGDHFRTFTSADGLAYDWVRCLLEDAEGRIWAGTGLWGSGAPPSGDESRWQKGGLSCWDGDRFHTYTSSDGLAPGMIRCVLQDREGHIWAGTWGGGVSRWDGVCFRSWTTDDGLGSNRVFSLHEDRDGYLWLGTLGGGITRCDLAHVITRTHADGLPDRGVVSLLQDRQGSIWIGTWSGVCRWDGDALIPLDCTSGLYVYAIAQDRRGRLWFGTFGRGALCWDGEAVVTITAEDGLGSNDVRGIAEDQEGRMWFATNRGLRAFDGSCWISRTVDDGLPSNEVRAVCIDQRGHVWAATDRGVARFDGQSTLTIRRSDGLPVDQIISLLEDRQGRMWFGTDGGGICRCEGEELKVLGVAEGLCHGQVNAMMEDRAGHLWLATPAGVSRFDGQVCQRLSRQDGLAHDAVWALLEDPDGTIWLGTDDGLTRYRSAGPPPHIRLTEVIADRRHGPVTELRLPPSQKVIVFAYEGHSLTTPSQNMAYLYRMVGRDDSWRVTHSRRVQYQDLTEGDYTFQLRAVDRDLVYSKVLELPVTVEPDSRLAGLSEALAASAGAAEFVGTSPALQRVQTQLAQAAPTDVSVLILGETGTGKGLAARMVHGLSTRSAGPLLHVNCSALPAGLVESELFGHERGAFTGATQRKLGKVEIAEGGTLFLDEIGDMAPEAQAKLLQILEERTFERVGGTSTLTADVRMVAATNRQLEVMVADGRFREDLYYRLWEFTVRLPPLRERMEDIPQLAYYFTESMAAHLNKPMPQLSTEALDVLRASSWPGNVRELEHAIKKAVIVCSGGEIRPQDLGVERTSSTSPPSTVQLLSLNDAERQHITAVLAHTGWVIAGPKGAAAILGLHEATLRHRMAKLGIHRPSS
jgi:DNA-binding NtrC family response regulator/ligand-binding sensor domain-containing protein